METIAAFIAALGGAGPFACLVVVVVGFIWLLNSLGHRALSVIERAATSRKHDP